MPTSEPSTPPAGVVRPDAPTDVLRDEAAVLDVFDLPFGALQRQAAVTVSSLALELMRAPIILHD